MKTIRVKVIPKSSRDEIVGTMEDGALRVKVSAAPEKGKANAAVCELIAAHFRVPKSRVEVMSGHTSAVKTIRIANVEVSCSAPARPRTHP